MIDTFIKILNNRIIDQLKTKFAIIDVEKRRIHLRHFSAQIEIERKIDFFLVSVSVIETKRIRNDFEQQTIPSLKKRLKFKISKVYFENIQRFFDKFSRKCVNKFYVKSNIY